jgi:hypothetical protein
MTTSVHRTSITPLNWAVAGTIALLPGACHRGVLASQGPQHGCAVQESLRGVCLTETAVTRFCAGCS